MNFDIDHFEKICNYLSHKANFTEVYIDINVCKTEMHKDPYLYFRDYTNAFDEL